MQKYVQIGDRRTAEYYTFISLNHEEEVLNTSRVEAVNAA
jgi:hypothetical protein